jgi:hypothetical protein
MSCALEEQGITNVANSDIAMDKYKIRDAVVPTAEALQENAGFIHAPNSAYVKIL